jgi:hypothetical protein
MRLPKPSVADLMSVVDHKVVKPEFAQEMLNHLPLPQNHIATDGFYEWCLEVHKGAMRQYYTVCAEEGFEARGQKQALVSRCWTDAQIQLGTANQTYDDWFDDLNLDIGEYNQSDLVALCKEILAKATGLDTNSVVTLKDIQASMVRLMGQLGSYSVQYSTTINDNAILDVPCATLRPDNFSFKMDVGFKIPFNLRVMDTKVTQKLGTELDLGRNSLHLDLRVSNKISQSFEITPKVRLGSRGTTHYHRQKIGCEITYELPVITNNPRAIIPVLGLDKFLDLTLVEQLTIPDVWHGRLSKAELL